MNTVEFKKNFKLALDTVDKGREVLITRGGKIYKVVRVN